MGARAAVTAEFVVAYMVDPLSLAVTSFDDGDPMRGPVCEKFGYHRKGTPLCRPA